ncbi:MAG TPA: TetR/AcrR family transcriptional regulator [Vitreimonas sp.]|jgi:AcrR family transcriptional regulator|nr:TetR/AcrR family transcriptional regulator [Vitreimonas sp.]
MPSKASISTQKARWQRRAEARPEEILEAALDEFTENGFDAARMEDIAKRAGLSKAGVYLYFPSKIALLEALIDAKVAPLARLVRTIAEHSADNPMMALRMMAGAAAMKLQDARTFAVPRLVVSISGRFPEIADFYRTHVVEPARGALEALLTSAMKQGAIREVDPGAASRAFIGPIFFEAMFHHVLRGESALSDPQKLIEQHFDVLLNGLEKRP